MLPQINRLKRSDFSSLRRVKPAFFGKYFSLIVSTDETKGKRLGFVISSKISKKAVERNRTKRILSKITRKYIEKTDTDFFALFLVKKEIVGERESKLESEVEKSFKKAKLIE